MVKKTEEILEFLKNKFADDTSDETLSLIEDVSDTLKEKDTLASSSEEWKKKYEDNDKQWREKYKSRFFNPPETGASDPSDVGGTDDDETDEPPKQLQYDDLFKKGE